MFTKSVHQPLGNFKSKNVSLVFSQKSHGEKLLLLGICLPAVISISCCNGPTFHRWCQDKPSRIWNRNKKNPGPPGARGTNHKSYSYVMGIAGALWYAKKHANHSRPRPQRKSSRPSRAVLHLDLEQVFVLWNSLAADVQLLRALQALPRAKKYGKEKLYGKYHTIELF